jgi:hypothetical protein
MEDLDVSFVTTGRLHTPCQKNSRSFMHLSLSKSEPKFNKTRISEAIYRMKEDSVSRFDRTNMWLLEKPFIPSIEIYEK